jgi:hypothetical protein
MAQTQEVIRERSTGVTPGGKSVVREKTAVSSPEAEDRITVWSLNRLVYYIAGVIETLLLFRFMLKILGANPGSPFVSFIYSLSGMFVAPFRGIFRTAVAEGIETSSVFEPATLFAFLVYLVVASGIVQLIKIMTATPEE